MAANQGLIEWVREAMAPVGAVSVRRMMGGATLYCDGIIFAIALQDSLWFKADEASNTVWDGENCPRFTYDRAGETATMNYRRAPDDVYDDPDAMRRWAGLALEAGARAPARKPRLRTATGKTARD